MFGSNKQTSSDGPFTLDENIVEEAKKVIRSIAIPTSPRILTELNQEMAKPEPEYKTIARLISRDVSLTAKILKIANSSFFALPQRVKSINSALSILGLDHFNNIVLTSAFRDAMKTFRLPVREMDVFYHHALQVAHACHWIAQKSRGKKGTAVPPNQAYMLGLFHDCGMPMLALKFDEYYAEVCSRYADGTPLIDVEEALYRTNHCVVGAFLARAWRLPEAVCDSIQYHHYPDVNMLEESPLRKWVALAVLAQTAVYEASDTDDDSIRIYHFYVSESGPYKKLLDENGISQKQMTSLVETIKEWHVQ